MAFNSLAFVTLAFLALVPLSFAEEGDDFYFIYSTPGGSRGFGGIYGGEFKPSEPEDVDLENTKINRAEYQSASFSGLSVTGLSHDPESKDILIEFVSGPVYYLAQTDPCQNDKLTEENFYFNGWIDRVYAGPFALYDSTIYYMTRKYRTEGQKIITTLNIRKVTGCKKLSFMNREHYQNETCSTGVAEIFEKEVYTEAGTLTDNIVKSISEEVKPVGSALRVVKNADKLHFLVQLANPLFTRGEVEKYSLDLYEVVEGGTGTLLHSQMVDPKWSGYIIQNMGHISYKDGLLCWTVFEHLLCSDWRPSGSLGEVQEVVKPGDLAEICNVASEQTVYKNIVSGIAIAKADPVELIFGCWTGVAGYGGAGYLSARRDWSNKKIKPIEDKNGKILGGVMAVIQDCPEHKTNETDNASSNAQALTLAVSVFTLEVVMMLGRY